VLDSRQRHKICYFSTSSPIEWVAGVKVPESEADYSILCSAEVKNASNFAATPPHDLIAWFLIKARNGVTVPKLYSNCIPKHQSADLRTRGVGCCMD
jgi:hypothetical protein